MAVIGVGSTGVQVIQEMGKVAKQLTVFLLEPNWCTPLGNGPMTKERMDFIKSHYYRSHPNINPTRIVPIGPALDYLAPHNRDRL